MHNSSLFISFYASYHNTLYFFLVSTFYIISVQIIQVFCHVFVWYFFIKRIDYHVNTWYYNYRKKHKAPRKRLIDMKKYNLHEIMKRAWNIFKNKSITFAAALKESWKISKEELQRKDLLFKNKDFYGVKDWFLYKTLTEQERYAFKTGHSHISKETEKAVLIKCDTKYGALSFWCPKKCLKTENEKEELAKSFESGLKYNELLVAFAKEHGVKGVRKGLRTQTIIEKIQEVGLEVPARV